MHMTMTMMRPGLFFQREGPGSEPGNSLLCPDEASLRCLRGDQWDVISVERDYCINSINRCLRDPSVSSELIINSINSMNTSMCDSGG